MPQNGGISNAADRYQLGSYGFATRVLAPLGVPGEVYLDGSMGHDIKDADDDFGTGNTTSSQTFQYIVERIVTYCQAIVNGHASDLNRRLFEDCENFRYGCNTNDLDDDNNCP